MSKHWEFRITALSVAVSLALGAGTAQAINQSGEQKNMIRLGHTDLQGRPSYQPNVIQYPDGRYIAFVGMHSGVPATRPGVCIVPAESVERRRLREQRDDDHRRHRSQEPGRESADPGP